MSRKVKVDMTGVESYTRCPEGEWLAKLKKIEMGEVKGSGDDALKAQFEIIKGAAKGCLVFETFSLTEKALWKLKSFLDAVGLKSDGRLSLDLDKLEGKTCIIDVIHDDYNGSKKAKIASYVKPTTDDSDDEDEDGDDDFEDEEEDEEEEPAPKKSSKKTPAKKAKKSQPADEDEDEEDEEEEEPPAKAKKKTSKSSTKKTTKKAKPEPEEDEDEDDDWEEDDD